MPPRTLSHIPAQALVPEQLISYVTAVGESRPLLCGGCVVFDYEGRRTLIGYAPGCAPDAPPATLSRHMNSAVATALADPACVMLTVLGPARPEAAPREAAHRTDAYAILPLPLEAPGQNLRNMLRRGSREATLRPEPWGAEHAALVQTYRDSRPLEAGTRHIYSRIPEYLTSSPNALLFAARNTAGRLLAFAIGDYTSLTTAFYMFAFRVPGCPPGVADCLLYALVREAEERGHQYINLGLGINAGIAAFKEKWGKALLLPCVQTAWVPPHNSKTAENLDPNDPLAVYTRPGFAQNLRRFFTGANRPFACLQVEVTSQCPGACTYCPHTIKRGVWHSRRMEDATFAALHPLVRRARRVHLQGWGEPLLHPRFFAYAAAASRVGSAVSTTTCGLGIDEGTAERLVASGIDIVAVSLAGTDETSNAARSGAPFAVARQGILTLNAAKEKTRSPLPRVHLAYLLLASQVERIPELPALMRELAVPVAVVSTLDYIASPAMAAEAYAPGDTAKTEYARRLLQAAAEKAAADGRTIHYSLPGGHGRTECNEDIAHCMYIDAAGTIAPCIYVNLPTSEDDPCRRAFGSARDTDPLAIWNNPAYARFRERLAQGDPDLPCVTCAKRFERVF